MLFLCLAWIANNTLLYQNEGEEIAKRTSTFLSHSVRVHHSFPSLCKNHKKPKVDKKIQACETLTLTEGIVFPSCRCSKQSVSRLLTLNWSEHFIRCGCFQICIGNNNTSLLLYACEVIHLINMCVTSPYDQE